ncbi:hypothetical protein V2J09_017346, partial [Rumex salicifolius]
TSSTLSLSNFSFLSKKHFSPKKKNNICINFKNKMKIMSLKCYSISCRVCHFPSNIHLLPNQNSSSWLPSDISKYSNLEHHKRRFGAIVLSNNGVKTRVLPSSPGLADATATAVTKPVDISVFIQISPINRRFGSSYSSSRCLIIFMKESGRTNIASTESFPSRYNKETLISVYKRLDDGKGVLTVRFELGPNEGIYAIVILQFILLSFAFNMLLEIAG